LERWLKNGSFDFAEALARVSWQKQMCHCGQAIKLFLKNVRWAKNKKHWVGLSVGFLVLSIFRFSVLSQWFTFQFYVCRFCFLHLAVTFGGMKRWGLRAS